MRLSFDKVGSIGVVKDVKDWQLPSAAWTEAQNIRFRENSAWKTYGYVKVLDPPQVAPHFTAGFLDLNDKWWVYAGLEKVYGVLDGTHYNLTRQSAGVDVNYTGAVANRWNHTVIQNIPIFNNGVDVPQMWLPVDSAQRLQALSNWPSTVRAKVMRTFKEYLVALNITKSGVPNTNMVKWSHPAEPGTVPITWDETDETRDAGESAIGSTSDALVDCLPLGNINVLYKQDSAWAMSFVGGNFIFRFDRLFGDVGMLAQGCGVSLGRRHFVVTPNDVILHDGQNKESILETRLRRYLFSDIDSTNFPNSFILDKVANNEIWFCYPENGETYATKALVWNQTAGAPSFRDLPRIREGMLGFTPTDATGDDGPWDSDEETWDSDENPWEEAFVAAIDKTVIVPSPTDTRLLRLDKSYQDDTVNISALLERTSMRFDAGDQSVLINNPNTVKQIQTIYPMIEGAVDRPIDIQLGYADAPDEPVTWLPAKQFVPGQDKKVDYLCTGNLLSIRFSSTTDDWWRLTSFDVDVVVVGNF